MFYAKQSPTGFGLEIHVFRSKAERDAWVERHRHDGDVNSAICGASEMTSREARSAMGRGLVIEHWPGGVNYDLTDEFLAGYFREG